MSNEKHFSIQRNPLDTQNAAANAVQRKSSAPSLTDNRPETVQRASFIGGNAKDYHYDKDKKSTGAGFQAYAYLDPQNPVNGSSPGGSEIQGPMTDLSNLGYKSMIKGHLINGQLGGPGVAANLFPITSQANSRHKNFAENHIKQEVTNRKGSGIGVYYSVEVTDASRSSSSPAASFTCEAYEWNVKKGHSQAGVNTKAPVLKPLDIESHPAKGSTGHGVVTPLMIGTDMFGNKFKYKINEAESLSFPNSKLGKGWGEEGSGKGGKNRDWDHTDMMDLS